MPSLQRAKEREFGLCPPITRSGGGPALDERRRFRRSSREQKVAIVRRFTEEALLSCQAFFRQVEQKMFVREDASRLPIRRIALDHALAGPSPLVEKSEMRISCRSLDIVQRRIELLARRSLLNRIVMRHPSSHVHRMKARFSAPAPGRALGARPAFVSSFARSMRRRLFSTKIAVCASAKPRLPWAAPKLGSNAMARWSSSMAVSVFSRVAAL